ncbi:MAG: PFL family protein [Clostridia bacterium]|nr:PFL family protein [Clostridia bacterium]
MIEQREVLRTIDMIARQKLDVRTITMGISLFDCISDDYQRCRDNVRAKIERCAKNLVPVGEAIENEFGIPIVNKRISVTPISLITQSCGHPEAFAAALDNAARAVGVNFIGGYSAYVQKGMTPQEEAFLSSIPQALSETEIVCSSVNVATTRAGINMNAVRKMGHVVVDTAQATAEHDGIGASKLVVFANAVEDNPFMAGALHGIGEGECVINVGVSGPGVVCAAIEEHPDADLGEIAEIIKRTAFNITRVGQLVAQEASARLNVPFGIIDLSLAPTPAVGDSVARILEEMGLATCGAPGSTAALALLNDAVKKGGIMASSHVGGLSGAFIPVSEDAGMIEAVHSGVLTLAKLEAMTCVCSVGLDMIALPGDTPPDIISAIIADEMAIGMVNSKTTAVRVIPAPGKKVGDTVDFGGLLGHAPVMPYTDSSPKRFVDRGGRIPAPLHSQRN